MHLVAVIDRDVITDQPEQPPWKLRDRLQPAREHHKPAGGWVHVVVHVHVAATGRACGVRHLPWQTGGDDEHRDERRA